MRPHSRRRFLGGTVGLTGLGLLAGCALPRLPWERRPRVPRIGWLSAAPRIVESFQQGLRELDYAEGRNIVVEWRYDEGRADLLAELAADLVRLNVDVIVTVGDDRNVAAWNATRTIPIVTVSGDPIGSGLATSLTRRAVTSRA